jgi:hypothetical protein
MKKAQPARLQKGPPKTRNIKIGNAVICYNTKPRHCIDEDNSATAEKCLQICKPNRTKSE